MSPGSNMDDSEVNKFKISKFDGADFNLWKFKMKTVLQQKKLWGYIDGTKVGHKGSNEY